ncbi:two-component regulator propeller domain-containing protein [Pedobacter sp. P351]|uniref:hybrid sensor histidine kinase/response regulator transcription factor n=1 Tax=Pedobacter superstes TaxID=3133441 RepID=UPI0030A4821D
MKQFFCFCLISVWIIQVSYARPQRINFTSLTTKDGLSSNTVTSILKDREGLMWFATEDGLNKYDGTSFTVYRHSDLDPGSLPTNYVVSLHEDRSGNLWIGTNGGSLVIYDRKRDSFKRLTSFSGFDAQSSVIRAVCSDYLGKVWVSSFSGLSVIDPKTKKVSQFTVNPLRAGSLSTSNVIALFEDSRRRLWVGTDKGVFLYNRKENSFSHFGHSPASASSLVSNSIRCIAEDAAGNIWIGTEQGLSMLMPDGRSFRNFLHRAGDNTTLASNDVYSIAADPGGKLWLGTEEGLNILDIRSFRIETYKPDSRDIHSLTAKSIRHIYIDRQGIYWAGTFKGGINKYDKNLSLFNLKQSNPFDTRGLNGSNVMAFAEAANGDVFVGTDGGGLNLFHRKTELFTHYGLHPKGTGAQSGDLSILALEMARNNRLWIGTYSNGLFEFDPQTGKYRQFLQGSSSASITNNNVFCLKEDSKGNIWIGTNGGGVNVYHPESQTFSNYHRESPLAKPGNLPVNAYIRTIEEDSAGNIWIGTHGSGMTVFNPETKSAKLYDQNTSKLPSNVVLSIFADSRQNIWVGTLGGGLSFLDRKKEEFISFSERDGLANGVVYKILEDKSGLLWLSTNSGISSFDPKTRKFRNYNRYNGVQNSNFNQGAGLRLSGGEMYFGGLDGFNYFYPHDIRINTDIPNVLIRELKVDNNTVVPAEHSPLEEHISIAKEINLDYKQNFTLGFVALSYTIPQQYRYSYKLEGFDKSWNEVGTSKTASYTNIDPGDYVFKVRVSNADGTAYGKVTTIKIHVEPPFWLTIYAYIFYGFAFLGILFYLRYRGIQKLKREFRIEQEKMEAKQQVDQERKEVERLHELDMLKIKFLTNLSHEFRTPISLIMGPVDTLLSDKVMEAGKSQLYMVKRNARRLLNLVNQLLDFRKMEEHELRLNISQGELVSFVSEVVDSFKDLSERKNIILLFESSIENYYTTFDHDKIERILFNVLSNAFKFTSGGGSIKVELEKAPEGGPDVGSSIIIKVTDTGIGIPADKQEKIFDRFFQSDTAASILNQGSGIGLSITREFVKMHGGTIRVESELEKGSSFIIHLPFSPLEFIETSSLEVASTAKPAPDQYPEEEPEAAVEVAERQNGSAVEIASILLVEDNDDFRFYLKDNLKNFYKVYEATNGKEGWQKALANHPQIIVSDINMPLMDGIEFCRKVKSDKRTSHIPIILLTALTGEEEQIKGLETGANDYMTKPFNFEILNAKIKNLLVLNSTLKNTYTKQIKVHSSEPVIESHSDKLLNKVVLYIEENINNPQLSVEDLSRHVGMSRGSLYNKILELTGLSPVEYIRSVKLDKAAVLLEKSDMNVAQIAYMVGFATPNYFAKSFKAKFNMQPSEYIALKRKAADNKLRETKS